MQLGPYFERIGFRGRARADIDTLGELLRCHVLSVAFENLDVQLGRPLTIAVDEAYAKIVERRRGGWCYEQNGLFGWALSEIGFKVTRLAAAVMRHERGEVATANHLTLRVNVPGSTTDYLADVGFGGSMLMPIKLEEGEHRQAPFRLGLKRLDDGHWRFWEDGGDGVFSFDFMADAGDEAALAQRCDFLQSDPSSGFVQNLVAQLRLADSHKTLRGRVFTTLTNDESTTDLLDSGMDVVDTLKDHFGLEVPGIEKLWPRILARHEQLFSSTET